MEVTFYQVDAFAEAMFQGNPAGVCVLEQPLEAALMQQIAMENNLAETAFLWPDAQRWNIRWFTPAVEVDLCGHATLASAHVLFHHAGFEGEEIQFYSERSGELKVRRLEDQQLQLNFPADETQLVDIPPAAVEALGQVPLKAIAGKTDLMLVFESESIIRSIDPDLVKLKSLDYRGIIVTAPGDEVDFVSRFFGPQVGIDEDPVTGSAHTTLTPYWSEQLNKHVLSAMQLSMRLGRLQCELQGDRVLIAGKAHTYLSGTLHL